MLIERIEDNCGTVIEVNLEDRSLCMKYKDKTGENWVEFYFDNVIDVDWLMDKLATISSTLSQ